MSRDLTDALSKLFIKLGGKTSDSKENKGPVDYIDDITDIVEPGSSGAFDVTFSFNESTETWSANKTFTEVKAAYDNGSAIIFIIENSSTCHLAVYIDETSCFECQLTEISVPNLYQWFIEYSADNLSVTISEHILSIED